MRVTHIQEPELEFGAGRHIDIRFGIMHYGPLDYQRTSAPKNIRIGVVGNSESVEGLLQWLDRCRNGVQAKSSRLTNLFPRFPGFTTDLSFRSEITCDSSAQRILSNTTIGKIVKQSAGSNIIEDAVNAFMGELEYIVDNSTVDVCICAVPVSLLDAMERQDAESENEDGDEPHIDFHHLLKARALGLKKPLQIVLPPTYDESKKRRGKAVKSRVRELQDEATRAWNFHTALYYKAGGTPWRLVRDPSQFSTCFIGVSFFKSVDESRVETSVAQVFNERGEGIVVKGGNAKISKEDRQPHLDADGAYKLLVGALEVYRQEHRTLPARIVMHKSSSSNDAEYEGFMRAIEETRVDTFECLSLARTRTRLYRNGSYPPLRGTLLQLDDQNGLLYTRGTVDFFATYPGKYVPRPLLFRCEQTESTPAQLAKEIIELTKMNWNNTQFDGGDPITVRAARQVGMILKYIHEDGPIPSRYSFYM